MGVHRVKKLLFTGYCINVEVVLRIDLVSRIVPADCLEEEATGMQSGSQATA